MFKQHCLPALIEVAGGEAVMFLKQTVELICLVLRTCWGHIVINASLPDWMLMKLYPGQGEPSHEIHIESHSADGATDSEEVQTVVPQGPDETPIAPPDLSQFPTTSSQSNDAENQIRLD